MEILENPQQFYYETCCVINNQHLVCIVGCLYPFDPELRRNVEGVDKDFIDHFLRMAPGATMIVQPNDVIVDIAGLTVTERTLIYGFQQSSMDRLKNMKSASKFKN